MADSITVSPELITAVATVLTALLGWVAGHFHWFKAPAAPTPPPAPATPAPAPAPAAPSAHPLLDMLLSKVDSRIRDVIEAAADGLLGQIFAGQLPAATKPAEEKKPA